ncbi:hypothetical protein EJB05_43791, partial [Eragrostis curvula]
MARACGRRLGPRPSTIDAMARQREDDAHARDDEGVRLWTRRDESGLSEADVEAWGSPVFGGHGRRSARGDGRTAAGLADATERRDETTPPRAAMVASPQPRTRSERGHSNNLLSRLKTTEYLQDRELEPK